MKAEDLMIGDLVKVSMNKGAEVDGDLDGVWTGSYRAYLEKQYIETVTLSDGTEVIVLDDEPWA